MNKDAQHSDGEAALELWPVRTVVADGSPLMLKTFSLLLQREHGLEVVGTATDGHHAVRRALEFEARPGADGLEVAGTEWV